VIAAGAILALAINSAWMLPLAIVLGLVYLVYYAIRSWMFKADHEVTPAEKSVMVLHARSEASLRERLAGRPVSDRLIDLLGSLLVAAVCCAVTGLLCLAAGGSLFDPGIEAWARYAWLAATTVAGSWAVLVAGKVWEHRVGDPWQRRFVMAGVGLVLGAAAFGLGEYLMLDRIAVASESETSQFISRLPGMAVNLALFTLLFGLLRWWRLADPVRKTRLSLWGTGLCVVVAALLSAAAETDPFWPSMIALVISVAVQVAAPRVEMGERAMASGMPAA
jgi:hypothetical protein